MKRHMKLSDVEAQTNYLLPRNVASFEKAYPEVDSIRVELRPSGEGFEPYPGQQELVQIYSKDSMVPIVNCRNPRCYGGGLDLDYIVRWSVVAAKRTEYETVISCSGHEGSPKGRRNYGPCDTMFRLKISVTYKS
jgi:hypothetical protein